MLEIYNF